MSEACPRPSGVFGLTKAAKAVAPGTSSRSNPSRFGARAANQIVYQLRQAIQMPCGEAIFGGKTLALGKAFLFQTFSERRNDPDGIRGRPGAQESDHRQRRCLGMRRERR